MPPEGGRGESAPEPDWARIADGCRRRDHASFEEMVELTHRRLRRLLGRLAGRRADIDELLQETYFRAWRGIGKFRGHSHLITWLTRIAVNTASNWRRSRRAAVRLTPEHAGQLPAAAALPEQAALEAYERALAGLSPDLRVAFVLHESEGMSYSQVAEVLGCPIGTVMSRLHRARARLLAGLRDRLEELTP